MTEIQSSVMHLLYAHDIWDGFEPHWAEDEVQGWNGEHPSLAHFASTSGKKVVIDIGVWKGQSTITMAQSMKRNHIDGVVIAIDTFLGSHEHWGGDGATLFGRHHGHPDLYWTFLSNVARAELTDYVVPMPQTSTTAVQILEALNIRASIVHVDAAHEYKEVLRDAQDYWRILEAGGVMIGDDYHESWPGVIRAARDFAQKAGQQLIIDEPKWIVKKPG
jgi:predicted O-methyltransferase YrrM